MTDHSAAHTFEDLLGVARDVVRSRVKRAADGVEEHVVPVYRVLENELEHEGSGVLLRLDGRYYLVSARHVFKSCLEGFAIPDSTGEFLEPEGSLVVSKAPPERAADFLDLGFVELRVGEWERLGGDRFLPVPTPGEVGQQAARGYPIFLVLGFPNRDATRSPEGDELSAQLTQFGTGLVDDPDGYAHAKVDPRYHLLLRYDRRSIQTARSVGAPPRWVGISGGGVWMVPLDEDVRAQGVLFAGIVLGRPGRYKKALQVVRSDTIFHFLRLFGQDEWQSSV